HPSLSLIRIPAKNRASRVPPESPRALRAYPFYHFFWPPAPGTLLESVSSPLFRTDLRAGQWHGSVERDLVAARRGDADAEVGIKQAPCGGGILHQEHALGEVAAVTGG